MEYGQRDYLDYIRLLQEANPNVEIRLESRVLNPNNEKTVYTSVPLSELRLPGGYTFEKNSSGISSLPGFVPFSLNVKNLEDIQYDQSNDIRDILDSGYTREEENSSITKSRNEAIPTPEGPAAETPEGPTAETPEEPAAETPEEPTAETPEEPTAETPEEPTAETPEEPTAETPEEPAAETPEEPAAETPEEPVAETPEGPTAETPEGPTAETPEEPKRTITPIFNFGSGPKKIVKNPSPLRRTVTGLLQRVKDKFANKPKVKITEEDKTIAKAKADENIKVVTKSAEIKSPIYGQYDGAKLASDLVVENLLKRIESDEYIKETYKDEIEAGKKGNQKEFAEKLREYLLIGELHAFAAKDEKYTDEAFKQIVEAALKTRKEELFKMNKILQEVRYRGIEKDQVQYLIDRLNGKEVELPFKSAENKEEEKKPEEKKDEPKKDTPKPLNSMQQALADGLKAKYGVKAKELFEKLGEFERMFVEDAKAEGLDPKDNEFRMMLNERTVNKDAIMAYYAGLDKLKEEYTKAKDSLTKLGEMEIAFIEDAKAEGLEPGDNEFRMMLNERTVNKDAIMAYYDAIKPSEGPKVEPKKEEDKKKQDDVKPEGKKTEETIEELKSAKAYAEFQKGQLERMKRIEALKKAAAEGIDIRTDEVDPEEVQQSTGGKSM